MKGVCGMHLHRKIRVENYYNASSWNYEIATKYIFEVASSFLEASYFEHYHNQMLVKKVIELSTSYGCPMKCGFCASSHIKSIWPLSADLIKDIYKYIIFDADVKKNESLVVSFTGMGDLYFTINAIEDSIIFIASSNANAQFTVSSCHWTSELLKKIELLAEKVSFRAIQLSFVSCDPLIVEKVIPFYQNKPFVTKDYLNLIETSKLSNFRINYIMMKDLNDSEEDFIDFIKLFEKVKNKVVIRIAKLNETAASERNRLLPPEIQSMSEFKQTLNDSGFNAYLFYSEQNDNMNCGQLVTECIIK